tara:strand:- start:39 stop:248 length:210 start_codon:yes stop_codon:yes gene_type:complete
MKIDKDIPIQRARSKTRQDIQNMEVGDSIWVANKKDSERYRHAMMRLGWSVTVRKVEKSPNGFRIWRVK